MMQQNIPC